VKRAPKATNRPVCGNCGKQYGHRWTESELVRWDAPGAVQQTMVSGRKGYTLIGDAPPPPPYRGNGIVTRERSAYLSSENGRMVMTREVWDGETWVKPYEPFCTMRCSLDFARKAFKAGYRVMRCSRPQPARA